jgi:molybdopterin molybdotransferase
MIPGPLPLWSPARKLAYGALDTQTAAEHLTLAKSDGRVLAAPLFAKSDLPPTATSAMDGWAICGDGPWQLTGAALAGRPYCCALTPGVGVVVATGADTPPGTTAVVRREDGVVQRQGSRDWLSAQPPPLGQFVRPATLECAAGQELLAPGTKLVPSMIGLLAAAGYDRVRVQRTPRVAILVFGDELLTHGLPREGRVRDSLGPQLGAWITRLGGRAGAPEHIPDVAQAHVDSIGNALESNDIVVTTGGTAAGPVDHLHTAIDQLDGQFVVDSAAIRPGHPMLLARLQAGAATSRHQAAGTRALIGLPGNPQSALIALVTLAQPVFSRLLGQPLSEPTQVKASSPIIAPSTENRIVPGNLTTDGFDPCKYLGSAMLRGIAHATGLGIVPPGGVAKDDSIGWLPIP